MPNPKFGFKQALGSRDDARRGRHNRDAEMKIDLSPRGERDNTRRSRHGREERRRRDVYTELGENV